MEQSIFLAKIFGVILTTLAAALLVSKRNLDLVFALAKSREFLFLTGIVNILLGTYIVLTHNIWETNWRGIITLFGYIALAKGLIRLFRPQTIQSTLIYFKKNKNATQVLLYAVLALGLYLLYVGFMNPM